MAVLHIKAFDDDLKRALKSAAANKDQTLQEFLEAIVARALGFEARPASAGAARKRS